MGVLLRAAEPIARLDVMYAARRAAKRDRDLCSGPARLCQAFGITDSQDGDDLVSGAQGLAIVDDGIAPPVDPVISRFSPC